MKIILDVYKDRDYLVDDIPSAATVEISERLARLIIGLSQTLYDTGADKIEKFDNSVRWFSGCDPDDFDPEDGSEVYVIGTRLNVLDSGSFFWTGRHPKHDIEYETSWFEIDDDIREIAGKAAV